MFYNSSEHIVVDIKNYILLIPIEEWLRVRPQLIICLKSNHPIVLKIINDIIISVGCKYPEVFFSAWFKNLTMRNFFLIYTIIFFFKPILHSLFAARSANALIQCKVDAILEVIKRKHPLIYMSHSFFYEDIQRIIYGVQKIVKVILYL